MPETIRKWKLFVGVYTIGIALGLLGVLLRATGRVKVSGHERLFPKDKGLLVLSNHLSYADFVLPMLYFPRYLINPVKYLPWVALDRKNFSHWYISCWLNFFKLIPIDRGTGVSGSNDAAVDKMRAMISAGEPVLIFPEGTRLAKAKERKVSPAGSVIGRFKSGPRRILSGLSSDRCAVVLVWLEGTDEVLPVGSSFPNFFKTSMRVRVSEHIGPDATIEDLEDKMLALADAIS